VKIQVPNLCKWILFLGESGSDELARGNQGRRVKPESSGDPEKAEDWER